MLALSSMSEHTHVYLIHQALYSTWMKSKCPTHLNLLQDEVVNIFYCMYVRCFSFVTGNRAASKLLTQMLSLVMI